MSTQNKNIWNPADLAVLVDHYQSLGAAYVAERTGRAVHLVRAKAHKLGLATPGAEYWSKAELELLRTHYPVEGADYVAEHTGRPRMAVLSKAKRLGISCGKPAGHPRWSAQEDAVLREGYPAGRRMQDLVQELGRNAAAIAARAALLEVKRPPREAQAPAPKVAPMPKPAPAPAPAPVPMPVVVAPIVADAPVPKPKKLHGSAWSEQEDAQLRALFADLETEEIARRLGRSVLSVKSRATGFKLQKSEALLAARAAAQAEKRLIKQKAKAQASGKKEKVAGVKKWFHYPMGSAEYNAGLAASTAGQKATTIIDQYGRPATVWRKAA